MSLPPIFSFLGLSLLTRSRSTGAGNGRGPQEPSRLLAVPASLFFVKLPCVERRRFAALVADINSVMSLRSWLPNVFW